MNDNRLVNVVRRIRGPRDTTSASNQPRKRRWPLWLSLGLVALILAGLGASYLRQGHPAAMMPIGSGDGALNYNPKIVSTTEDGLTRTDSGQSQPDGSQAQPQPWDRMINRTATLQMQVESVGASMDKIRLVAAARGGYVTQSDSRQDGEHLYATLTIQVPAGEFDAAITELRKLGVKPPSENITSSDVTEEYTDLQSQLRNLEQTESRIFALMQKAERIEDILNLDRELRTIRGEIERIRGRSSYLSKRAEMSTITISLAPELAPVQPMISSTNGWDPGEIALRAWNASLDLLSGIANVLITAGVFLWWALPLLLVGWLLLRPRRRAATTAGQSTEV